MYHKLAMVGMSVLLFGATPAFRAFAQTAADSLAWEPERKLSWDDFQGAPEENTIIGARTFTTIKYRLYDNDTACRVVVRCLFLKKVSWKAEEHTTIYSLQHEQLHFDISELFARKLRKAFKEYKYSRATVNSDIAAIFKRICAEKTKFNKKYDKETVHCVDMTKQLVWNNKIYFMLEELKDYAVIR